MEITKERPKASSLPSGTLVEMYIQLRDRRALRKAAFENEDAADKGKQEKMEGILMQRFNAEGIDSVKSAAGTAYTDTRVAASVADTTAFYGFCVENDEIGLMEIRASKTNIQAFKEANGDLPPGVNWSETKTIKVRRS